MAHALRKLLRHTSSDHNNSRGTSSSAEKHDGVGVGGGGCRGGCAVGGGGGGGGGGPASGSPVVARRNLLARACNSVHRDTAKVSPAEKTIPTTNNNNNHNVSSNNVNGNNTHNNNHNTHNSTNANEHGGGAGGGGVVVGNGGGGGVGGSGGGGGGGALSRASSFFTRSKKTSHVGMNENTAQHARLVRTRRLMKEYQEMCRQQRENESPVFTVELVEDNLFEWNVKLLKVDPESELYRDMQEMCTPYVLLNLTFPDNFPFAPPFMRVIAPRIEKGFVMEGGAICMELLTPRGWASAYTVEAVIMQFAASLVKGQGRIARKNKGTKEFNRKSAEASFRSLVKTHEKYGWVTPPLSDG